MGKASRAATARKFALAAAKAKAHFRAQVKEAGAKKQKAKNAARREKSAKAAAKAKAKADEKATKAQNKKDLSMKGCALDGSECQTPNGKCHKTTKKGPFMA